jgi:hypothetical protein
MVINPYEGLVSPFSGMNEQRRKRRKHSAGVAGGWQFPGASFDLDFANGRYFGGNLTDLLSCSRASSGYVENADGTLTFLGSNVLRVGVGKGLYVSATRTNFNANSQAFSTWGKDPTVLVTDNVTTSPEGALTASSYSVLGDGGGGSREIYTLHNIVSGANHALSVYVKRDTANYFMLGFQGTVSQNFVCQVFDLTGSGSLGEVKLGATSGTLVSASIQQVANGYFRVSLVANIVSPSAYHIISIVPTPTGNVFNSFGDVGIPNGFTAAAFLWQADYIQSSFVSVPVFSAGGSSAGAADAITAAGAFGTIGAGGAMTLYFEGRGVQDTTTAAMLLDSNDDNDSYLYFGGGAAVRTTVRDYLAGLGTESNAFGYGDSSTHFKAAFSGDRVGASWVGNNGVVATRPDAYIISTAAGMSLGAQPGGSLSCNSYIMRVAGWNSKLPDSTLKALTV